MPETRSCNWPGRGRPSRPGQPSDAGDAVWPARASGSFQHEQVRPDRDHDRRIYAGELHPLLHRSVLSGRAGHHTACVRHRHRHLSAARPAHGLAPRPQHQPVEIRLAAADHPAAVHRRRNPHLRLDHPVQPRRHARRDAPRPRALRHTRRHVHRRRGDRRHHLYQPALHHPGAAKRLRRHRPPPRGSRRQYGSRTFSRVPASRSFRSPFPAS